MLSDSRPDEARPPKKRKLDAPPASPPVQTVSDSSEGTGDSDVEWEEVEVGSGADYLLRSPQRAQEADTLEISIGGPEAAKKAPTKARRKAATAAEKLMKLNIHKVHVLCLLYHSYVRNAWCNDPAIQASLKRFLNTKMSTSLTLNPKSSQFQATRAFVDGLNLAKDVWKDFKINATGTKRAKWAEDPKDLEAYKPPENEDTMLDISDLRKAAIAFEGSPDTGAQLFCAFLRASGVETRLVASLQPLPFASAANILPPVSSTPAKATTYVSGSDGDEGQSSLPVPESKPSRGAAATPIKRIKRMGQPRTSVSPYQGSPSQATVQKSTVIPPPRYPVYWVEAFNTANQKWLPVDPIATMTVGKPFKIEPPLSDLDVNMTYVVAFEADGVAKDVTRRYAKAYNAKTRKLRVETTPSGDRWWRKAMKIFRRGIVLDRDQVEDAELAKREASEEMPKNMQDFKDHPYYVLERHLRHNEVIHPKREVGKVNVGSSAVSKLEPIYRRRDVHSLKSADKWYRLGREVKPSEQPLKHAKPRRDRHAGLEIEEDPGHSAEGIVGAGLYADIQTELYVPPPIVRGRVPRNAFGNLDVYVASMVPRGGVHIRHRDAARASRILGIDYADAVTGFQFKGRHGTAIKQGVIVAENFKEAVESVIEGLGQAQQEDEKKKRSNEALRLWRRFLLGLRIKQQVQSYASGNEERDIGKEVDRIDADAAEKEQAGGFFRAAAMSEDPDPTGDRRSPNNTDYISLEGGFVPEDNSHEIFRSSLMRENSHQQHFQRDVDMDMGGGGFLPDDSSMHGSNEEESPPGKQGRTILERENKSIPNEGGGFLLEDNAKLEPEDGNGFSVNTPVEWPSNREEASPKDAVVDQSENGAISEQAPFEEPVRESKFHKQDVQKIQEGTATEDPAVDTPENALGDTSAHSVAQTEPDGFNKTNEMDMVIQSPHTPKSETSEEVPASEDDKGSLLSHDPEDEDAEPEWLLSD
ncbi:uncharacterized protein K452DRAFT_259974 [Aplosporella prunicola CBS 121167]|uniref:Rad4 beta-hairpin domain-containing protein n=1 Tax=Aplosporella prunicola CBS 121167 TaxID=1176127 RepID=A0A6A6AYP7_9PEZI|nr:uncharacterized protein K452DRAFT_259974 [Aplosporella prunicola CBS 121167]KAF2135897.1 hypothetical protein K452DRAFT_259974 [Aplosporella prunicola CBS 121167]